MGVLSTVGNLSTRGSSVGLCSIGDEMVEGKNVIDAFICCLPADAIVATHSFDVL